MMFSFPLIFFECMDVSLLTRVHPSQQATALCDYAFTGSKYALCIQTSAMELSVNAKICDPYPICRMVMYMVIVNAMNSRRLNVSFPFHTEVNLHRHARPFLL